MTDTQLYLAIGVPVALNATILGIAVTLLLHHIDKRLDDFRDLWRAEMRANQSELLAKFAELDTRLVRLEGERRIVS